MFVECSKLPASEYLPSSCLMLPKCDLTSSFIVQADRVEEAFHDEHSYGEEGNQVIFFIPLRGRNHIVYQVHGKETFLQLLLFIPSQTLNVLLFYLMKSKLGPR